MEDHFFKSANVHFFPRKVTHYFHVWQHSLFPCVAALSFMFWRRLPTLCTPIEGEWGAIGTTYSGMARGNVMTTYNPTIQQ